MDRTNQFEQSDRLWNNKNELFDGDIDKNILPYFAIHSEGIERPSRRYSAYISTAIAMASSRQQSAQDTQQISHQSHDSLVRQNFDQECERGLNKAANMAMYASYCFHSMVRLL